LIDSRICESGPSAEAVEFVRFCYRRRRLGWPELYDEMCAVASRGLYHGWGTDDLSDEGVGFSLYQMPTLAALVSRVVTEERERQLASTTASVVRTSAPADAIEARMVGAEAGTLGAEAGTLGAEAGTLGAEAGTVGDEGRPVAAEARQVEVARSIEHAEAQLHESPSVSMVTGEPRRSPSSLRLVGAAEGA
jgi:hypothetical protein